MLVRGYMSLGAPCHRVLIRPFWVLPPTNAQSSFTHSNQNPTRYEFVVVFFRAEEVRRIWNGCNRTVCKLGRRSPCLFPRTAKVGALPPPKNPRRPRAYCELPKTCSKIASYFLPKSSQQPFFAQWLLFFYCNFETSTPHQYEKFRPPSRQVRAHLRGWGG